MNRKRRCKSTKPTYYYSDSSDDDDLLTLAAKKPNNKSKKSEVRKSKLSKSVVVDLTRDVNMEKKEVNNDTSEFTVDYYSLDSFDDLPSTSALNSFTVDTVESNINLNQTIDVVEIDNSIMDEEIEQIVDIEPISSINTDDGDKEKEDIMNSIRLYDNLLEKLQPTVKEPVEPVKVTTIVKEVEKRSNDCPICFEKLFGDVAAWSTICGHVFCHDCIMTAVKKNKICPKCRKKLRVNQVFRLYLD